jgi:hypothetical protein
MGPARADLARAQDDLHHARRSLEGVWGEYQTLLHETASQTAVRLDLADVNSIAKRRAEFRRLVGRCPVAVADVTRADDPRCFCCGDPVPGPPDRMPRQGQWWGYAPYGDEWEHVELNLHPSCAGALAVALTRGVHPRLPD